MKPEIAKRWVETLRSGEYKQGRGYLRKNDQWCCLGVLCDIYRKEVGECWSASSRDPEGVCQMMGNSMNLPRSVAGWADISSDNGYIPSIDLLLSSLNDNSGYTFDQLADLIEKHSEEL